MVGAITEHFSWQEARCRDGCAMPDDVKREVIETAKWLERIREHLGGRPVIVHSWYRCPEYNRKVGGAPNSQHLYGRAVDFTVRGLSIEQVWQKLLPLFWGGYIKGMGRYATHVHADRRPGGAALWFGKGVLA